MEAEDRTLAEPAREEITISKGDVIGEKYRVEEEIGSGGMGVVLSARHIAMGHRFAIKILRLDNLESTHHSGAVARFLREARAAARIESDHVVRVIDVAALRDGTPYMVMEYLEGEDLRGLVQRRGQIPIEEAIGYVLQACEGLAEAHASGVIHRDLKPSNLFLAKKANGTNVLKVLDFGISKVAPRPGEVAVTTTNSLVGSPLYMAPEQMRSSRDVDVRADVWSLGLILFELLAGTAAFEGETVPEVCVSVMSGEPLAMTRFRDDVPNELQAILLKCIEKNREDRYPTMGALARALEGFASEERRVHADRASAALRTPREALVTLPDGEAPPSTDREGNRNQGGILVGNEPDPPRSSTTRRTRRSKRPMWLGVGAATCVVAAAVGTLVARGAPIESPTTQVTIAPSVRAAATAPAEPVATAEVPSVAFDSLPAATHDAGVARVTAAPARKSPAPVAPATSSSANAAQKEGWKWGDRN